MRERLASAANDDETAARDEPGDGGQWADAEDDNDGGYRSRAGYMDTLQSGTRATVTKDDWLKQMAAYASTMGRRKWGKW